MVISKRVRAARLSNASPALEHVAPSPIEYSGTVHLTRYRLSPTPDT